LNLGNEEVELKYKTKWKELGAKRVIMSQA